MLPLTASSARWLLEVGRFDHAPSLGASLGLHQVGKIAGHCGKHTPAFPSASRSSHWGNLNATDARVVAQAAGPRGSCGSA